MGRPKGTAMYTEEENEERARQRARLHYSLNFEKERERKRLEYHATKEYCLTLYFFFKLVFLNSLVNNWQYIYIYILGDLQICIHSTWPKVIEYRLQIIYSSTFFINRLDDYITFEKISIVVEKNISSIYINSATQKFK